MQERNKMKRFFNSKKCLYSKKVNLKKLTSFSILEENYSHNMMYILYRIRDNKLRLTMEKSLERYISKDYKIIGSKVGSERELGLIKMTLSEINLNRNDNNLDKHYYEKAISHLKLLGCNIINKKELKKKLYLFSLKQK